MRCRDISGDSETRSRLSRISCGFASCIASHGTKYFFVLSIISVRFVRSSARWSSVEQV